MRRGQLIGSVAIIVMLAACSSSGSRKASGSSSSSLGTQINAAMKRANTMRIDTRITGRDGALIGQGQCVVRGNRILCKFRSRGGPSTSITIGGFSYTSAPQQQLGPGKAWLREPDITEQFPPFGPIPATHRIGTETIDGIRTTHYRYTKNLTRPKLRGSATTAPPAPLVIDLWIDSDHLIRRLTLSSDSVTTETEQYSDFGTNLPPITAPSANKVTDNPFPAAPTDITPIQVLAP